MGFLFSHAGLAIWQGDVNDLKWVKCEPYQTSDGTKGEVRVCKEFSHVRLTSKKPAWEHFSTLQLRTIKCKDKTTISFHQERMTKAIQCEEMLLHWEKILDALETKLK